MSENKTTFDVLCEAIKPEKGELQKSEKLFIRLCALVFEENGYKFDNNQWNIDEDDNKKLLGVDFQKKLFVVCDSIPDKDQKNLNELISQDDIDKNKAWLTKWGTNFINDFVAAMKGKLPKTPEEWSPKSISDIFKKNGGPIIKKYAIKGKLSGFANVFTGYWSGLERLTNGQDPGMLNFIKSSCNEIKKSINEKIKGNH